MNAVENRPEKLLVVKERYLILANYDLVKAELLYRLDIHQDWRCVSIEDLTRECSVALHPDTMRNKVRELLEEGLIEKSKKGRTLCYRIAKNTFDTKVKELQLLLVEGVVISPDEMASPSRKMSYEEDTLAKNHMKVSQGLAKNHRKVSQLPEEETMKVSQLPEAEGMKVSQDHEISSPITTISNTVERLSVEVPLENTVGVPLEPTVEVPPNRRTSKKSKFYDWTHYDQFTPDDWMKAKKDFVWPKKENDKTLIIGAYLLGMWKKHRKRIVLATGDYNKYMRLATEMLDFFAFINGGDQHKGFNTGLDWIREFVESPVDSFFGKEGWPIQMCFTRDVYRQKGNRGGSTKKLNNTGTIVWTQEEREARERARESDG